MWIGYDSPVKVPIPGLVVLVCLASAPAAAQNAPSDNGGRKQARAVRVAENAIRVDGRLDEEAWNSVPPVTDFVQKEPVEGSPPTDRMEVRFAYDDDALIVGARMYSDTTIQAPMGRRDDGEQAEHLLVSLDTYLDRRTSSTFGVTASGVRLDHYHASDNEFDDDDTFDPVWQARTAVDGQGWTAELWIPFAQLRFNDRSPQVWGLNVQRWVPSRNELVFWALVARTEERWASLFGDLNGIDGIRPSRRLEIMPYVATDSRLIGDLDPGDPFNSGANLAARVGADLKVGLGSNLTLEATVNPDFGQVEADPAEVNLSAFETFFDERRPFFVEGANLLTGVRDEYFYSRRIGAQPGGDADGEFVDYPPTTTILGAAKLTGRLASGMSIGMLGAVTDEESARTFTAFQVGRVRVAPRTAYGVARIEQEFGQDGSNFGVMATTVNRQLDADDPLASVLARNAFAVSGDSIIRFGDYQMVGFLGLTHVDGEPGALLRLQRTSARYFQRPDVDYVRIDPTRTSMRGANGGLGFERQNGRHWLWEVETSFTTPGFETNDIGQLSVSDGVRLDAQLEYRETVPGAWYREYSIELAQGQEWNFGGERQALSGRGGGGDGGGPQNASLSADVSFTWPNFWQTEWSNQFHERGQDMRLTRGGPSMERPQSWFSSIDLESSDASETQGGVELGYGRNEDGGLQFEASVELTMRPAPQWQLSVSPSYEREVDTQQYVTALPGGGPATFGRRYIFGNIDRSTYATEVRLNYTFKPDLNLDFYAEPFAASGRYSQFGELAAARSRLLLPIDPTGTSLSDRDFRVQSFRSNLVLRWEWRPGSTLYVVWQQDRETEEALRTRASLGDMFSSFGASGDNFFAIKASWWFSPR
jgi:hypothetical protein